MESIINTLQVRLEKLENRLEELITVTSANSIVLSARQSALMNVLNLSTDQLLDLYNRAKEEGAILLKESEKNKNGISIIGISKDR